VPIKQAFIRQGANLDAAVPLMVITALLLPFVAQNGFSQVLNQHSEPTAQEIPKATVTQEIKGTVKVTVETDKRRGFLAPRALGVVSLVSDKDLMDPMMPQILQSAGVTTLRYPAGTTLITITGPPTRRRNGRDRCVPGRSA
jgi:hypothetical protein